MSQLRSDYPKISVIIPVYNVVSYLNRCLESIMFQTYPNIEVLLIDDGSTDGSSILCDKWGDNFNIIVIHQTNHGVSRARNLGLSRASGDYISFVDPDDYIDKDMYLELYKKIKENNADIAACTWQNEFEHSKRITVKAGLNDVVSSIDAIYNDIVYEMFITCNKLYSRNVCDDVFYDEEIINGEDRLFDIQVLLKASKVVYVNKPYYHYCHRKNSAGTKKYTKRDRSLITASKKIINLLENKDASLISLAESHLQHSYMQLLGMMDFQIYNYKIDGAYLLTLLKRNIIRILMNHHNNNFFKIKALVACMCPFIMYMIVRCRQTFVRLILYR